jgi:hypothetical protein
MVKNITLSADESLIRAARERAQRENSSLNACFREWLRRYAGRDDAAENYRALTDRLEYARAGRHFSREEMNER